MYEEERVGDRLVLKFTKDLVASEAKKLKTDLLAMIERGEHALTIDFSRVQAIDSSGLGVLIATQNTLATYQNRLQLTNVSAHIKNMLKIMRLDKHFEISS
ncbi:STAS domain-containing protein [Sulfidibacter corallicola]|uniref:STAS domain-containing protein n=1 Tax=Sulfidibacter corallicola TaxID=2818388 RepID=A0A8A4TFP7_SULCO|nr:STAS domain-containing protein [Sulfidibacter corallicola]QTD48766.1 STAS domain-containing protein [Sulfidibacter corallicola]